MRILALLSLLLFAGCRSHGVFVHQQKLGPSFWASTYVGAPDPRATHPLKGEMLVAEWWVPKKLIAQEPTLRLELVFHNFTSRTVTYPICQGVGTRSYLVANEDYEETGGILTYKAEIVTEDGEVFRSWKHQLYVELITIDDED